jgi:hypothetical protein
MQLLCSRCSVRRRAHGGRTRQRHRARGRTPGRRRASRRTSRAARRYRRLRTRWRADPYCCRRRDQHRASRLPERSQSHRGLRCSTSAGCSHSSATLLRCHVPGPAKLFAPALVIPRFQPSRTRGPRQPVPGRDGTIVALQPTMFQVLAVTAMMPCPHCRRPVAPAADSTWVIAWYSCPRCGHDWSARIRNGRPDSPPPEDTSGNDLLHTGAVVRR